MTELIDSTGEVSINNLPEDIMIDILSRIRTHDAVQLCLLSKDWKYTWKSLYSIAIDDLDHNAKFDDMGLCTKQKISQAKFIEFMETTLCLLDKVTSLRLSCWGEYESNGIEASITNVLSKDSKHNIEGFRLFYVQRGLKLSFSIFNCTSLKKLEVLSCCTFMVQSRNSFPNLTMLYLDGVEFRKERDTKAMLIEFPILKKLKLRLCKWFNVKTVLIEAPALTTFKSETADYSEVNETRVWICQAKLAKVEFSGGLSENCLLSKSTVTSATLLKYGKPDDDPKIFGNFGSQVRNILNRLSSLKELKLSGCVAKAIEQSEQKVRLPVYKELERLTLHSPGNNRTLMELLQVAPVLKFLVIDRVDGDEYNYFNYDPVKSVPSCIMSHLEEVKFNYYAHHTPDYFHLEKFLLKHGVQLKKFYASGYDSIPKDKIVEKLSTFPRASTSLKIIIVG